MIDQRPSYLSSTPAFATATVSGVHLAAAENVSDDTKRVNFQNNFYVPRGYSLSPQISQDLSYPCSGFFLNAGSVVLVATSPSQ